MLDSIEYKDEKRQKTITDMPFQFRDFSAEITKPLRHEKKRAVSSETEEVLEKELSAAEMLEDQAFDLEEAEAEAKRIIDDAEKRACAIFEKASASSDKMLELAKERVQTMEKEARDEGFRAGYEEGKQKGMADGLEESYQGIADKFSQFFSGLEAAQNSLDLMKQKRLQTHADDMKDLVLTIAKKVIHVSLETSGEVIKQMILTAAENGRDKQWSRVFISGVDVWRMQQDGIDINQLMRGFSDRIKIVINEDAPAGSCVVEFPDQIIDAGVDTQLRNIKGLLNDFEGSSESEVNFAL